MFASNTVYYISKKSEKIFTGCLSLGQKLIETEPVPDLGSRINDVVLVRRIFSSGKPQGVGILEWGGDREGMEMGRSVYEQPGTKVDRILSRQGGFPSK